MKPTLCGILIATAIAVLDAAATAQPANDDCANAIPVANHSVTSWNPVGATQSVTLPCDNFPPDAVDVWYSYTTTGGETVTITTCGGPTEFVSIGVFAGCGGPLVACDSWSCIAQSQSQVTFQAPGPETYYICLVGYLGVEGPGYLAINAPITVPPPPNDTCNTAQVVTGPGSYPFDTRGAAVDSPPAPCNIGGRTDSHDVFFRYTPSTDGWVRFDTLQNTQSTRLDTTLQVFDGCGGALLACNDDVNWTGVFSGLWPGSRTCPVHVSAASTYIIRVACAGAASSGGQGVLRITAVTGPIVYTPPADAIAEPGPTCEDDYNSDPNYGCNPRVSPPDYRATPLNLCDARTGHIHARTTPVSDGTLIHDFDAYRFTLTAPQTVRVKGQAQFVGLVTLFQLPCGAGTAFSGQLDQYTNPECGSAEFDLAWDLAPGEYHLGIGVANVNQPNCGQNDEYWFRITGSGPCPGPCPADLGQQGGIPGQDEVLDNNDFVVFIDYFFNADARADFGLQGGVPGQDGLFDNNDFVVFIDAFFAGCP
ncbi:MAG TPA: GC-type dockerin domain-anchored protein [Phycisphaerales bacterium]|nr:GC-type dockerin domain-anchored protein [Phycisphaerales bacterium]